jgi:putative hydrolase of the HAD superfamily
MIRGLFFDFGDTLVVEEPGKHLRDMELRLVPGAVELLERLRPKYRIGIISNTSPSGTGDAELASLLERIGLANLVDAAVTSKDFGAAKPDPAIYKEGARRLGIPLAETCMVGDRLDTDVAGALKAGIPAVWLRHAHATEVPGIRPTHVIRRLSELTDWLYTQDGK